MGRKRKDGFVELFFAFVSLDDPRYLCFFSFSAISVPSNPRAKHEVSAAKFKKPSLSSAKHSSSFFEPGPSTGRVSS